MDSFQDEINYENRIVPEDRDKLISLLEEYSSKLRRKCDSIDRLYLYFFLVIILFIITISVGVVWIGIAKQLNLDYYFLTFSLVIATFLGISSLENSFVRRVFLPDKNTISSNNHEAHSLAYRLEKLVRVASEFYEHVEKKEISKIELDLKIAEAESVLNYYDSIVGRPKKYSDKKRA